ncbi:MAG: hypothetical protein LBB41_03790 [Prevotellaceae bacterium]|jgi:hypothetical protein|nr:hypothetical protein [Prevotellaceae bacterium]
MGLFKKKNNRTQSDEDLDAIAISTALQQHFGSNADLAAIAVALQQFFGSPHDTESNILTIRRLRPAYSTQWNAKVLGFNKLQR